MEKKAKKNGFTARSLFAILVVPALLAVIVVSQFVTPRNWRRIEPDFKTDIKADIMPARPEIRKQAFLYFNVPGKRLNLKYQDVQFKDYWPYGSLDEVFCSFPETFFDPNSQYPEGESWEDWIKRYEKTGKEHASGLKPIAEDILREREEREKEKK